MIEPPSAGGVSAEHVLTDLADRLGTPLEPARTQDARRAAAATGVGQRNLYLHYLRGFAALFVVLYHCSEYLDALRGDSRFLSVFSGFFGGFGVAIFFAISGYLMAEVLRRDDPARFIMSRVARIYPLMLIVIGLSAAAFALVGFPRGVNLIALTLVPSGPRGYFLGVEWTLLYEMTYYVGLGLLGFVGLAAFRTRIVVVWLGLLCFAYSVDRNGELQSLPILSDIPLSIVSLPFVLGYLAAEAQRRGWLHPAIAWLAVPFALTTLVTQEVHFRLFVGLAASFLLAGLICAPAFGGKGWLGRAGVRLGDASYALYLCHVPVILILGSLLGTSVPTVMVWPIWLAVSLGVALLLGPLDVAIYRRLKRAVDAARPGRLRVAALSFIAAFLAIAAVTGHEARMAAAEFEQARRIVMTPNPSEGQGIRADIDTVERMPKGTWVIRGYAIDLARPELSTHFAVRQNGTILGLVAMRRVRPDMAAAFERLDLKGKRFGFMMLLDGVDCTKGVLEGVIAVEDGRAVKLPTERLTALCQQ